MRLIHTLCLLFGLSLLAGAAQAAEVKVAVAANFAEPMRAIAAVLTKSTGHTALITVGSTGKLATQIMAGAPFDVFLAANLEAPAALEKSGHAVPGSRLTYATGRLVLWSANPGLVDAQGQVLAGTGFRKIALAAPHLAPYGAAAVETLKALGQWERLQPQVVQGDSIGQTYGFVHTGHAELGFVAYSQVLEGGRPKAGSMWLVPARLHAPIDQGAVLLRQGADNPAARALLDLLRSPGIVPLLSSFGYTR